MSAARRPNGVPGRAPRDALPPRRTVAPRLPRAPLSPPGPAADPDAPAVVTDPAAADRWLAGLGLRDREQAWRDLRDLGRMGLPPGTLGRLLAGPLHPALRDAPDPGLALTGLERFLAAHPDRVATLDRLASDAEALRTLVGLCGTSRHLGEQLVRDPSLFDWLCRGPGPRGRAAMAAELADRLDREAGDDLNAARSVLRRFKTRELLRIALDDVRGTAPLEATTAALSALADACLGASCRLAEREAVAQHGEPRDIWGRPVGFAVLAMGKLGGGELNYSSDIDLIYVYETEGRTIGARPVSNADHFARLGGTLARLLSDHTEDGQAYRVDLRLRPEGAQGPLARSVEATLAYYRTTARTWERQALLKARPVAGDLALGARLLAELAPAVHGRPLDAAAIGDILVAKRRIEARAASSANGSGEFDVKLGVGGIRDVEFLVQFLQLLHGADRPELRPGGTLAALDALAAAGALLPAERAALEAGYRFLRRAEHHVQAMFDLQTHRLPKDPEAQRVLAIRMGFPPASAWEDRAGPAQRFHEALRLHTRRVRSAFDRLLVEAFRAPGTTATVDPLVDAALGAGPSEAIARRLAEGGIREPEGLAARLGALAAVATTPRGRHALAAITPRLVAQASRSDDPDAALAAIVRAALGRRRPDRFWDRLRDRPRALCQWGARAIREDEGALGR